MPDIDTDKFVKTLLLVNGVADSLIALGMIFLGRVMGATTGMEFYAAGGWGIATFALGLWRIWASKHPEAFWFTAMGGIIEGGVLALFSVIAIPLYSLELSDTIISLLFGFTFSSLYIAAFVLKNRSQKDAA